MNLPTIGHLFASAKDLLASRTTAAPSVVWEEFPAVEIPSFLKEGLSLASPSAVVASLMPSSLLMTTSLTLPSLSFWMVATGMISSADHPFF